MGLVERFELVNSRNLKLVGLHHFVNNSHVVVMCHGFTSDKTGGGIFDTLAQHFVDANLSVIRFDFSGCGESDDDTITIAKEIEDLRTILEYVTSLGYSKIGLFGHSLGGLICCHALSWRNFPILTGVLMAPVTRAVTYDWATRFTDEQLAELSENGIITKRKTRGVRSLLRIDGSFLRERESVNQSELLRRISAPICIVHGTYDERILSTDSESAMQYLPLYSHLELIEGANHNFSEHLDRLCAVSRDWFIRYFF
jgi:pimeloyl-ACP methyl ester carboxylesterase